MKPYINFGQVELAIAQAGISAGELAIEYSNNKKLAALQASFKRQLDSDAAKIDYTKDITSRFKIAARTLAHTGKIPPRTELFETYLSAIVKDDMEYVICFNLKVCFKNPA